MRNLIGVSAIVILLAAVLVPGVMKIAKVHAEHSTAVGDSPLPAAKAGENPDKVMVIVGGIGNQEAVVAIETKVNQWLAMQHDKITVKGISSSGDNRFVTVMIWYKDKTD